MFAHRPDGGSGMTAVGCNNGSPFSHRQVVLLSGCPNCHGWIVWSGRRMRVEMQPTGFSSAIRSMGASSKERTNSKARSVSRTRPGRRVFQCRPEEQRYVHGGKAIIRSQPTCRISDTSPWMCNPDASEGSRSQLQASCPSAWNASRTHPENSHATRIFIISHLRIDKEAHRGTLRTATRETGCGPRYRSFPVVAPIADTLQSSKSGHRDDDNAHPRDVLDNRGDAQHTPASSRNNG